MSAPDLNQMLQAALAYAKRLGWPVFPCCWITEAGACSCGRPDCGSPGKHPLTGQGFKEATRDEAQIRVWWTKWPAANIGIPTGAASGFDVLDVDPRHGGEVELDELELMCGQLPATVEAITGGGGRHVLFRHQEGVSNKTGFLPGLDVRGEGGYVLAAPSRHASGRLYQWELSSLPGEVEFAEWPAWALELVRKPGREEKATPPPAPREGQSTAYGRAALEGEAEKVRRALPGLQETTLNEAAFNLGTLVAAGVLDHGEALAALVEAGGQMQSEEGRAPWTVQQVQKKAEHGLADGMKHPREVPALSQGERKPTLANNPPSVGIVSASPGKSEKNEWPEPQPLPDALPPVEPFEPALLPEAFRPWIEDIAQRLQCPPDFPAVGAMVALAAVVGRQVALRPKLADDWAVVPNLWGAVVGRPGLLKTPALQEVRRPLDRLEARAREQFEAEMKDFEADLLVVEAQQKNAKEQVRKALKQGQDPHEVARAAAGAEEAPPRRRRYLIHDPTVEKLGEILRDNPRGVLVFRDELTGFLRTLDRDGHEGDRSFYLESWNGTSRYSYDRIGRGTIDIDAACVSILGGIQPGPLSVYMARAAGGGGDDDGLVQRFQLVVWPDQPGAWRNVDRPPDAGARRRAVEVFERLDCLSLAAVGAEVPGEEGALPFLRFAPAAQELFTEWRTELEHRLRSGELPAMLEGHLAKYRSLIPSLALLVHLADVGAGPVGEAALRRACGWGDYLESHAQRIYAPALAPASGAAQALAEHIRRGDLEREFALRDVQRPQWSGLSGREEIAQGLELLEELDWVRTVEEPTAGRPRTRYTVNPRLFEEGAPSGQMA